MTFFIKECPDDTVMLLDQTGRVVAIFDRLEDAIDACGDEGQRRARLPAPPIPIHRPPAIVFLA